jgi:hypothetical protein
MNTNTVTTEATNSLEIPLTLPYYRPRVEIDRGDFKIEIGPYSFLFCSTQLRSLGSIHYRRLLLVFDESGNDSVWVTAESNDMEGESVIYLGCFTPRHHATITQSPALVHAEFFVPVACQVAREVLDLPYDRYPLTPGEDVCIAAIPGVFARHYPQEVPDEAIGMLMAKLMEAVLVSNTVGFCE